MDKEIYDWVNKELNSHNFYDIKEDKNNPDNLLLVWKKTEKVFATLYKESILKAMAEDKNSVTN